MYFDFSVPPQQRLSSPEADKILGVPIPLLDYGSVALIDYCGSDKAITNAARVSYGDGTKQVTDDEKLIEYLYGHDHLSPFEMVDLTLYIKCPIFVARQLFRHRTHSANEESARYSIMSSDMYLPDQDRLQKQSTTNKQGSDDNLVDDPEETYYILKSGLDHARETYDVLTAKDTDLTRELARGVMPVNTYTQFYWKQNLRNMFHLINLRMDSHAQYEIREYGQAMALIVEKVAPVAYRAFLEYTVWAERFSDTEAEFIRDLLHGKTETEVRELAKKVAPTLTGRKLNEFIKKIGVHDPF